MKVITISVTALDITRGNKGGSTNCPIARATRRCGRTKHVSVGATGITVGEGRYNLPKTAQRFVQDFDNELPVKPFSFKLRVK